MNIGYLFLFPPHKAKSLKIKKEIKNKNKNKNYITFTDYNSKLELPNTDLNLTKFTKFNCINCEKINYSHNLFCDIDCKTSYEFKKKKRRKTFRFICKTFENIYSVSSEISK